jgi:transaldolase
MSIRGSKTKALVDGGDPQETVRVKGLIGLVDGQTTNPTLIARNPEVRQLISSGHKLSTKEELDEYKKIVQAISPLVGDAGVSIEACLRISARPRPRYVFLDSEWVCQVSVHP